MEEPQLPDSVWDVVLENESDDDDLNISVNSVGCMDTEIDNESVNQESDYIRNNKTKINNKIVKE